MSDDSRDLADFGYRQELDRSLGGFSSFAAGFSYISILTGLFQMFYLGFGAGGDSFIWSWPLVFAGQFLVALGFAELAAHYPLSGGVYQWSKLIGSPFLGWMVGWIYVACLVVTLAAVVLALQNSLPQIAPVFQVIGQVSEPRDAAMNAVLFGCALILFTTILNSVGVGILAVVNNIGVFSELVGVTVLIVLLALNAVRSPEEVLFGFDFANVSMESFTMPLFASAALTASYVMYGFDTAGSLAEETLEPRKKAPRAILQALSAAAVAGLLVLLFSLMAVRDLKAPELGRLDGGLPWIVKGALGESVGVALLIVVVFAILVCALAVHTGAVRLIYAMARDRLLPFSDALSRVSPKSKTPVVPAILVGVLAILILVANVNLPKVIELVTMVAVLWANLAYLLIMLALLLRRFSGWPASEKATGVFALGRFGIPVNAAALAWSLFMVVNVGWPRASVYGVDWRHRFAPVILSVLLLACGALFYGLVRRSRAARNL